VLIWGCEKFADELGDLSSFPEDDRDKEDHRFLNIILKKLGLYEWWGGHGMYPCGVVRWQRGRSRICSDE
jgi:hypothetical protein